MPETSPIRLRPPAITCFPGPESRNLNGLALILSLRARGRQFAVDPTALEWRNRYGNLLLIRCRLHKFGLSMQLLIADYISQAAFAGVTIARRSLAATCAVGYLSARLSGTPLLPIHVEVVG